MHKMIKCISDYFGNQYNKYYNGVRRKTHFKTISTAFYYINMKVDCNEDKEVDLTWYGVNA